MKIYPWSTVGLSLLEDRPVAATIGVFDGVHRGHQYLLQELVRSAGSKAVSLVVTFKENPKKILNNSYPGDLMTWEEKLSALESQGISRVVLIDFSMGFSTMSGRDFFRTLKKSFVFSTLVLGWDFSFGKDSAATVADLGWLADPETRLTVIPPYHIGGDLVSSSEVRKAVVNGDFKRVTSLLGRPYVLPLKPPFRWENGVCSISRQSLEKLLPSRGIFPALVDGQRILLTIEKDFISWESPPGISLQNIVFV